MEEKPDKHKSRNTRNKIRNSDTQLEKAKETIMELMK